MKARSTITTRPCRGWRFAATIVFCAAAATSGPVIFLSGCRSKKRAPEQQSLGSPRKASVPPDPHYKGTKAIAFHEVTLRICDRPAPNPSLSNLPLRAARAARRLGRTACFEAAAFLRPDRAIVQLPPELAQGRSLELILRKGRKPQALVDRSERRFWWSQPAYLLDVLEGTSKTDRTEVNTRFLDAKEVSRRAGRARKARKARKAEQALPRRSGGDVKLGSVGKGEPPTVRLDMVSEHTRGQPSEPSASRVRFDYTVYHRKVDSLPSESARMLVNLGLMVLGHENGWSSIEHLRSKVDAPVRWRMSFSCRSWAKRRRPVVREVSLAARPDGRLASVVHLPANRAALPPPEAQRRFGPVPGISRQEIPAKLLSPVRPPLGLPTEPRRGKLQVRNQSQRAAVIYVDSIRLGTVAPGLTFDFTGLPAGYYRVTGVTAWSLRSWGPRDLYVPGVWTLGD